MDRVLTKIKDTRQLEEAVFPDGPSFAEPLPPVNLSDSFIERR